MAIQLIKEHNIFTLAIALLLWPIKVVAVYFWLCFSQVVANVFKEVKALKSHDGWER